MDRILLLTLIIALASCAKEIEIDSVQFVQYTDQEYADLREVLDLPRDFDLYTQGPKAFGSATKATLGRVLFYDKSLSEDGSVSCGSCHKQEYAFADNTPLSSGIYARSTDRNSLALGAFSSFAGEYGTDGNPGSASLFWDLRADNTHLQIESTMANEKEMGMQMEEVVARIKGKRHYEILFQKAFSTHEVEGHMVLSSIEAFMQGMTAGNSKFDQMQNGFTNASNKTPVQLTDMESRGLKLFAANCASCHGKSINVLSQITQEVAANNGLERESNDRGMGEITSMAENDGLFKIPSLRNITLTAPYMHDGRFETLEEVIDFYSNGIQPHKNLGVQLQDEKGQPRKFNFSQEDKSALIAFFRTLTDISELRHKKFSDPWIQ
ncbi:MAG: c-type cytochrome [Saprospiraceae bacterium]|nr:c-type cytochrome [Saprospiraceae bacterium]